MKKIAIVTGANIGLGYETALALSKEDYKVILACRNIDKAEKAKSDILAQNDTADLDIIQIDLSSLKSVRNFAQEFLSKYKSLDLLINNAGIFLPPYTVTEDGFELTMGANYFGHFLLTGLLLDTITSTKDSRIVTLSSAIEKQGSLNFEDLNFEQGYNAMNAYAQSKLACVMYSYELQRRLEKAGIKTLSLAAHPGASSTNIVNKISNPFVKPLFKLMSGLFFQSAAKGALPTLEAALGENVQGGEYYGPDGFNEMRGNAKKVKSSPQSYDEAAAARLWEESEKLTGFTYTF